MHRLRLLGRAYWMHKCDNSWMAKICLLRLGCCISSCRKSKQMCMEGTPFTITSISSLG
jgi:hypothetical protein